MKGLCVTPVSSARAGFTLLELILAMVLSVVLLAALWTALDLHLRAFEKSRTQVEESQLARALLREIATDLRRTLAPPPPPSQQVSAPSGMAPAASVAGILPIPPAPGGNPQAPLGLGPGIPPQSAPGQSTSIGMASGSALPSANSSGGSPRQPALLLGNETELRLCVPVVLRGTEEPTYDSDVGGTGAEQPVGALRRIHYWLAEAEPAVEAGMLAPAYQGSALVRRDVEWFRLPTAEENGGATSAPTAAATQGETSAMDGYTDPLQVDRLDLSWTAGLPDEWEDWTVTVAPEVRQAGFRYFDGGYWSSEWNSTQRGRLPAAVEITLVLPPASARRAADEGAADDALDPAAAGNELATPAGWYRMVVALPSAEPLASPGEGTLPPHAPAPVAPPLPGAPGGAPR